MANLKLVALYQEDLQDIFKYLELHYLVFLVRYSLVRYNVLYEKSAAYADNDYGLCSDKMDRNACLQEQRNMAVLYTCDILMVSLSIMMSAYYLYEPSNKRP